MTEQHRSTYTWTGNQTSLRVCFGALADLVKACQPWDGSDPAGPSDEARMEAWASQRAVATIVAGGYMVGVYKDVFAYLSAQISEQTPAATIVNGLLDQWYDNPPCAL